MVNNHMTVIVLDGVLPKGYIQDVFFSADSIVGLFIFKTESIPWLNNI